MESLNTNIIKSGALEYLTFKNLSEIKFLRHAFSTRLGGVSEGNIGSMNLSFHRGDKRENVIKNYEIICKAARIPTADLVFSKQTHTDNIKAVTKADCGTGFSKPEFSDIDGLITNEPHVALVTQYADCTPLLFCDPKKRVIGASHSGWRGTVKQIGRKTVEKMHSEFGCEPSDIIAAVGPCIHSCCYEVDGPVFNEFLNAGFDTDKIFKEKPNGKYMLDLAFSNKLVLLESGIKEENIEVCDICTSCNSEELFSHRVMGNDRGNLAALIEMI